MDNKPIKIDISLIPEIDRKLLGKAFYECVKEFYSKPENVAAFEKWKNENKTS